LPNCEVSGTVSLPQNDHLPERYNAKVIRKNYFVLGEEENEDDDMQEPLEEDTMQELQVKGIGWYDHQFGAKKSHKAAEDGRYEFQNDNPDDANVKSSYTWISLQLDNGNQMCLAKSYLHDDVHEAAQNKDKPKYYGIMVSPTGEVDQLDPSDFDLIETGELWVSMRTFRDYPTNWEISVPSRDTNLQLKAAFDNQEFPTMNVHPHFWEGAVKVKGTFRGQTITGKGFVERKGFCPPESMTIQHFFKVVSRETLKSCRKVLPFNPEGDDLNKLVCHKDNAHYTEHIDSEQFSKALVEPIRAVMDRGGKSWRSYAALACCDVVGGDSQPVKDWLALPELVHVGSLIVDDVEDRSTIRRGGPCSHLMYGEDVAINAGTMAYFLGQMVIYEGDGDAQKKVDIYNMYFEGIRAAHSGQAMDIHGLDYMMPDVVENGGDLCRQRVVAIHRLKSAAPVSFFSKIGAKLGGGSKAQSDALGDFFEALGIAFQIVDDVLNLRGFTDGLKTKGEDITAGKVTYPVAKAMCRLEKEDRAKLWEIVSSRPEDIETIGKAVALIEKVNGIEGSFQDAKDLIEDGWKKVDPLLIDSFVKINLRAFSLYILDRTY
ncbi:Heterodimeric geranylgeranyl pyrophosphate synthase large subunit (Partial), partial [Seminavis robusta]